MRWRGYECKDTGFPIKNVGNDRRGECRNAMPLPLVKARGMPNAPFAPLDPALCSGRQRMGTSRMRCGRYKCKDKDTGFPIKNVGNDRGERRE